MADAHQAGLAGGAELGDEASEEFVALDEAVAVVVGLMDAVGYRDVVELRGWALELATDPALVDGPRAAAVLGVAAEAAYQSGDYPRAERLARTGLDRATDKVGSLYCLLPLAVAELARGAHADVVDHALALAVLGPHREGHGLAALATAYAGDLDRARTLNGRGAAAAVSPSMRSWAAYVAGEIEGLAGRHDLAEEHYLLAVELARTSGATFLVGVATVGLLTVRATAGRVPDALRGYREVIDYFAGTGNWTHLWTTLRNLADLLRHLDDADTAALLEAAADAAPDAPGAGVAAAGGPSRAEALARARQAIDEQLSRP